MFKSVYQVSYRRDVKPNDTLEFATGIGRGTCRSFQCSG